MLVRPSIEGMLLGWSTRCLSRRTPLIVRCQLRRFQGRGMASSASGGASHGTPSAHAPTTTLRALTDELDRLTPRFDIEASQIHVLKTPTDFYETLKVWECFQARRLQAQLTLCTVQNLKGPKENIPLDTLHWQSRTRAGQSGTILCGPVDDSADAVRLP